MKKEMIFVLVIASAFALVMMGCQAQPGPIGGDKDEHGCIPSAGYSWCDAKEKCLRTWEENCTKECADSCPLISQPAPSFCIDGTIVDQGKDDCDCQLPPKCEKDGEETGSTGTQIANPASVYCEENGGTLEIVTTDDGSQSGVCTLSGGTKCDEWAYFRGECPSPKDPKYCDVDADCNAKANVLFNGRCAMDCFNLDAPVDKNCSGKFVWEPMVNNCVCKNHECQQSDKHVCTGAEKAAEICTMEYAPVCGWFDESIQCIKYPCAQTYGNKCQACAADNVAYWTEGECPE